MYMKQEPVRVKSYAQLLEVTDNTLSMSVLITHYYSLLLQHQKLRELKQ